MIRCEVCGGATRPWELDVANRLDRCPRCGHVARDLVRCPAGARRSAWGGSSRLDQLRLWLTYRRLRRAAGRPRRVFEAGYGNGALLARFLGEGSEVAGADVGELGVRVDAGVRRAAQLYDTPVEQVPEPVRGSFDLVYAVHVAEHVGDVWEFARACARLLRPGGCLVWLTPTADSDGPRLFGADWWMLEDPGHVRFFSASSVRRLLTDVGFEDITVRRSLEDSLAVETSSLLRRLGRGHGGSAALQGPVAQALAALALPVVLLARMLRPSLRPTLEVTARWPGG